MDFFAFLWAEVSPWEIIQLLLLLGVIILAGLLTKLIYSWTRNLWPYVNCEDPTECTQQTPVPMAINHLRDILRIAHDNNEATGTPSAGLLALIDLLVQVCMMHGEGPYVPPATGTAPHWKAVHKAWKLAGTASTETDWLNVIEELTHGA
ncbi:MAG: hypothetical protein ACYS0K_02930 [Planctomycetota bacterium]|jgi:hypothetical protein